MSETVDIRGAADFHVHFGPNPFLARSVDAIGAARDAAARGHSALVLKAHEYPTASMAWAIGEVVPEVRVFGAIALNPEVGGVNPLAVDIALRLGAKVVWLPTMSSRQDVFGKLSDRPSSKKYGQGLTVTDWSTGELLPEVLEVMSLVESYDAVLATGHISVEEHVAVAREFGRRGRLLITHGMETIAGPELTVEQCVALADLGGIVEMAAITSVGAHASRPVSDYVALARAVGPERCIISSDFGQVTNVPPAQGLQNFADALHATGLSQQEVRRMAVENPCSLLGIPVRSV